MATTEDGVQTELQDYLNSKGINSLFISIVEALLVSKPDKPIQFIVEYLHKNHPEELSSAEPVSAPNDDEDDSDDDDEDDDELGEIQAMPPPPKATRGRRVSVSAESMDAKQAKFEKVVHEKDGALQNRIKEILKRNILFANLDEKQVQIIVDALEPMQLEAGVEIIKQGDMGDYFYLMDSGTCEIFKDGTLVQTATEAMSFGELALMYNSPRAATVTAKEASKLFKLDRMTFKFILMDTTIRKRELHKGFLEKVSILSHLNDDERLRIADALVSKSYSDGEAIITEGEAGEAFFILEEGSVECLKGGANVGNLESGQYFGEVALLTNRSRQATVKAKGAVKCLSLERKTFKRVMGPLEDILQRNMTKYDGDGKAAVIAV
jgi:cAMP-dependent protein kinase regulator